MGSVFQSSLPQEKDFSDVTRRVDILQRVMALISSGLELEPLLSKILDSALTLIQATHGTIGLVVHRSDNSAIRTVAVYNMPEAELGAEMTPGVGLAGRVLRDGRAIRLDRYGELEQPTLPELAEHSVIGVPIGWRGEMIGFFGIGAESPHRFNEQDVETLELFAQYAAVAIHNAHLFEASRDALDEMRLLYETSQRIGLGTDVDEVITAYLEQVARRTHYVCNVCLYEFDAEGQRTAVVVRGRWNPEIGFQHLEERVPYARDKLDPLLDAKDASMTAGSLAAGESTVPWIAWPELGANGKWQIFVSRLDTATRNSFLQVGASLNVDPNQDARTPIITFVGNVPYVSWLEDDGTGKFQVQVRHLASDPQTGTWALDTPSTGFNADAALIDSGLAVAASDDTLFMAWTEGDPASSAAQIVVGALQVGTAQP